LTTIAGRSTKPEEKLKFRPDIEGIRAVAVLFVLIWHAGVPWLPGGFVGVDVFFVVSGFLMTSILHREMVNSRYNQISVLGFYGRRARRLIPASTLVLVATAIATVLILPETRWRDIGFDIAAAGAYGVNWLLADRAVDYLAQGNAQSPIQHFWSLSVEEQFYIFWPLLLVPVGWLMLKLKGSVTKATFGVLAVIFAASLAWSVYYTADDPGRAYFVTTTRLWELALGGLIALTMPFWTKLPGALAAAAAWIGFAGIFATGFLLTTDVPFPGSIALVPTVSTALVIAAGPAAGNLGPVLLCKNKVVQWIGGCSYSMYLWHWPFLVIGGYWITSGLRDITVIEGVVLAAVSVLPAWLSLILVEDPVRKSDTLMEAVKNSITLAFFGIISCVITGLILSAFAPRPPVETSYVSNYVAPGEVQAAPIGAELLAPDPLTSPAGKPTNTVPSMQPSARDASSDNPAVYAGGCHLEFEEVTPKWCAFGDLESPMEVYVVGDSHAAQWMPALQAVAVERGWKLQVSTKSSCPFMDIPVQLRGQLYEECTQWGQAVQEDLAAANPAAVIMSFGRYDMGLPTLVAGATTRWAPITSRGIPLVVIRDTPRGTAPECIVEHEEQLTACAKPREQALGERDQDQPRIVAAVPGAQLVDLTDWICPDVSCSPVIGGVLLYRDDQHLTATYSRTLADPLGVALAGLPGK
jgi:peptidoglycan/LPS O-acetylase OafA/YrhL